MLSERNVDRFTYKADCEMGFQSEDDALPYLCAQFQQPLRKSPPGTIGWDFERADKKFVVELKRRRMYLDSEPTQWLPWGKINQQKLKSCLYKDFVAYEVFWLYDGLYYIKYDRELFNTFAISKHTRNRLDKDEPDKETTNVDIPVSLLTKFRPECCPPDFFSFVE